MICCWPSQVSLGKSQRERLRDGGREVEGGTEGGREGRRLREGGREVEGGRRVGGREVEGNLLMMGPG